MQKLRRGRLGRYIGDREFYRTLMAISIPIMLQNAITNLVSLLDNIMVGAVGTEQMTGVSIVNQVLFVFNLCIFGGLAGAGIFTAQFYGRRDLDGVRHTFRFKLLLSLSLLVIALCVFGTAGNNLIELYLHEGSETGDLTATLQYAREYLVMMLWGLLPFALNQVYASTLRENGETMLPMKAGITAILVNLCLNWVFIFGHLGMPAMGARGAALATVISRYIECAITLGWTHTHKLKMPFIMGAYRSMHIPGSLTKQIFLKGMPLLINEALWSSGMATLNQSYSTRGLAVVAGLNISSTISNLFNVVWMALGISVSIIVGQHLGANKFDEARTDVRRIMAFSLLSAIVVGAVLLIVAPFFPMLYNTSDEVRALATGFLRIGALAGPLYSFCHVSYFTLRSGGKTWITFLFDSVYLWLISIPLARLLTSYTALDILTIFALCEAVDIIKCTIGYILLKKGVWIHNIVENV